MSTWELERNVLDSFLLNFDKVLLVRGDREFTIPSRDDCERVFIRAFSEIYGKDLDTEYVRYCALKLKDSRKINQRILDAINLSFSGDREYENSFQMHLSGIGDTFDSEFFMWYGTYYRYYPKAKEKAIQNINSFFNKAELDDLDKIGELIKKYRDIWWGEKIERAKK